MAPQRSRVQVLRLAVLASLLVLLGGLLLRVAPVGAAPPGGTPLAKAHEARADAAEKAYGLAAARLAAGAGTIEAVYTWSARWMEAERDLGGRARAREAARAHAERMVALEKNVRTGVQAGVLTTLDEAAAAYYVADAIALTVRR